MTSWHLDEIDKSLELNQYALTRTAQLRHSNTTGYGVFYAGALAAVRRRDFADVARYAMQLQELSRTQWIAWGSIMEGVSFAHTGKIAKGMTKIEAGLHLSESVNNIVLLPTFLSGLAETQMMGGR